MTLNNLLKNWNVESIEAVEKGWSSDRKYRVRQSNGDTSLVPSVFRSQKWREVKQRFLLICA
jgi:hypothetical protein